MRNILRIHGRKKESINKWLVTILSDLKKVITNELVDFYCFVSFWVKVWFQTNVLSTLISFDACLCCEFTKFWCISCLCLFCEFLFQVYAYFTNMKFKHLFIFINANNCKNLDLQVSKKIDQPLYVMMLLFSFKYLCDAVSLHALKFKNRCKYFFLFFFRGFN